MAETIDDLAKIAHRAGQDTVGRPLASWPKDDALSVRFYTEIARAVVLALRDDIEIVEAQLTESPAAQRLAALVEESLTDGG